MWGVKQGLPYAYNADENAHFVPKAIGLFGHGWNPHYFVNPPAYTYLLHVVFAVWFGGRAGVSHALATDPTEVFVVARVTAAVLGTLAVVAALPRRARGSSTARVGLLAAALLAVAFLPVFYSHLALNDVPTLAPIASRCGARRASARRAPARLRCSPASGSGWRARRSTPAASCCCRCWRPARSGWRDRAGATRPRAGSCSPASLALAAFVVANPYAVLDLAAFRDGLQPPGRRRRRRAGQARPDPAQRHLYYLWTFTWGLGWVPRRWPPSSALGLLARRRPPRAARARPGADPLRALHGHPGALLRALAAAGLPDRLPARAPTRSCASPQLAGAARARAARRRSPRSARCCSAGRASSTRCTARWCSRAPTRATWRAPGWSTTCRPARKIVVEPVVPDAWAQRHRPPVPGHRQRRALVKFPTSRSNIADDGSIDPGAGADRQHRGLRAHALPRADRPLRAEGLLLGGQSARRSAGARRPSPTTCRRRSPTTASSSAAPTSSTRPRPYRKGAKPGEFNFDWSFDFYPLAYDRPGPVMPVYRLQGRQMRLI